MNHPRSTPGAPRRRAMRLYVAGQLLVLLGAGLMSWMHSYLPMALAGSAALMMTVPLVRSLLARNPAAARRARR